MAVKRRPLAKKVLLHLGLLPFLLFAVFPFYHMTLTSLKTDRELYDRHAVPLLIRQGATLDHYQKLLWDTAFLTWIKNSLLVTAIATTVSVVIGIIAAYALARLPVPGRSVLLLGIVASTAFPQIATVSPLYLLLRALGLRDTWTALVLAHTSFALPLTVWLLAGFIRELPRAVEESAAVDGASGLQTLRWVLLPLLAPGVASAGLLAFLFSWNEFLFAYTFTASEASRTVPVALALFPGVFEVPWGDIAAASMLASLPPVLIVVGLQRYLVRGLLAGAVKD